MRIALVLSRYFPHGGMQRDFLGITYELCALGHDCFVYCHAWHGDVPSGIEVRLLPVKSSFFAMSNHGRLRKFEQLLQRALANESFDGVVGFEKMPGLNVCFVPDACFSERAAREHGVLYRCTPRYRHFASWEKTVFDPLEKTHILCVSTAQQASYRARYNTPSERLLTLPAGILSDRSPLQALQRDQRTAVRRELGVIENELALLFVGSAFKTKGLDRAIRALASVKEQRPDRPCRLLVIGADSKEKYQLLAQQLGVADKVEFLGGRSEIIALMSAADVMLHPARTEAGGAVLLEALVVGLPVIVTGSCGHAVHTAAANAGIVLPEPFDQSAFNGALVRSMEKEFRKECRNAAQDYLLTHDLYGMHASAAQKIQALLYADCLRGEPANG